MNHKLLLENSLKSAASSFRKNELAYLTLTSKPELLLRDRVAYELFCELENSNLIVSREWKRTDLTLLNKNNLKPQCMIEFKAMHAFDALTKDMIKFKNLIENDVNKARKTANNHSEIYSIVFMTHVKNRVSPEMKSYVKYFKGINTAFDKAEYCIAAFESFFDRKHLVRGTMQAGCAFGLEVEVGYWIYGPF